MWMTLACFAVLWLVGFLITLAYGVWTNRKNYGASYTWRFWLALVLWPFTWAALFFVWAVTRGLE